MGDSTFRYPPGAPGARDGGTGPGNRGAGSGIAGGPAPAGGVRRPREPVRGGRRFRLAGVARQLAWPAAVPGRASRLAQASWPADGSAPAVTYWRRRFVVLAVALATLAAAAWSLSEAFKVQLDVTGPATTGHGPSGGGAGPQGGSPGGATGTRHGHGADGAHGAHSGRGSASGAPGGTRTQASHRPGGVHKPTASPSPGAFGGFKPKFCSWHSIVLSASANQADFAASQRPSFSVSVVSTQPTDCSFNVGPGHLGLIIKEGPARIWSSADCVTGSGSLVTALRRGVPTVVAISWNKKTSTPGCAGPARSVPAGTYTAYAVDGSLASGPVTFRLR